MSTDTTSATNTDRVCACGGEDSRRDCYGLSGTGAGVGTVIATYLTGVVADRYSFRPVLVVASAIPLAAAAAIVILVRNTSATRRGVVYPI